MRINSSLSYKFIFSLNKQFKIAISLRALHIIDNNSNSLHQQEIGYVISIRHFENFSPKILFLLLIDKLIIYEINFDKIKYSKISYTIHTRMQDLIFYEIPKLFYFVNDDKQTICSLGFCNNNKTLEKYSVFPIYECKNEKENKNISIQLIDVQKFSSFFLVHYSTPEKDDSKISTYDECFSKIYLTDLSVFKNKSKILEGPKKNVTKVFYSPDYSRDRDILIAFYEFSEIRVWKMKTLECVKIINYNTESTFSNKSIIINVFSLFQIRSDAFYIRSNYHDEDEFTSIIFLKDIVVNSDERKIKKFNKISKNSKGDYEITNINNVSNNDHNDNDSDSDLSENYDEKINLELSKIYDTRNKTVFYLPSYEIEKNAFKTYLYSTDNPQILVESTYKII
jgi:hypothetical protein